MSIQQSNEDLDNVRQANHRRLLNTFEAIYAKYSKHDCDDDIVDIMTGEIIEDNGRLRSLNTVHIGDFGDPTGGLPVEPVSILDSDEQRPLSTETLFQRAQQATRPPKRKHDSVYDKSAGTYAIPQRPWKRSMVPKYDSPDSAITEDSGSEERIATGIEQYMRILRRSWAGIQKAEGDEPRLLGELEKEDIELDLAEYEEEESYEEEVDYEEEYEEEYEDDELGEDEDEDAALENIAWQHQLMESPRVMSSVNMNTGLYRSYMAPRLASTGPYSYNRLSGYSSLTRSILSPLRGSGTSSSVRTVATMSTPPTISPQVSTAFKPFAASPRVFFEHTSPIELEPNVQQQGWPDIEGEEDGASIYSDGNLPVLPSTALQYDQRYSPGSVGRYDLPEATDGPTYYTQGYDQR